MSIDFHVYVPRAASDTELVQVIGGIAGLDIDDRTPGGGATVVRGARRVYCCTIEDPMRVDAEDVPTEVAAVTLGAAILYEVLVEGSSAAGVAPARRIAWGLAKLLEGAVVDPQTDEVWSAKTGRVVVAPRREERVGVIELDWCFANDHVHEQMVRDLLELCRRHLPEALPRRYGDVEPMQHRFEQGGADAFVALWSTGTSVFWNGKLPSAGGHLMEPPGQEWGGRAWNVSLDFLRDPFDNSSGWREALRRLFVAVAEELGAIYACAQVTAGHTWSGGDLGSDEITESSMYVGGYWWRGLPPHPVWWSWYGPDYMPVVADLVAGAHTVAGTGSGLFQACSELPRTCRQLTAEQVPWFPDDLLAQPERRPARRIPAALEVLAGKRSEQDTEYWQHNAQERARRERRARLDAAEQLVTDDLRAAGVHLTEMSDLRAARNKLLRKPQTVRVLADQLDRDLPWQVKKDVIYLLADARSAATELWPDLRERYLQREADDDLKFALAYALGRTAGTQWLAELIELVENPHNGATRAPMLGALKRFTDPDADQALQRLRADEHLGPEARRLTS